MFLLTQFCLKNDFLFLMMTIRKCLLILISTLSLCEAASEADQAIRNLADSLDRSLPSSISLCTLAIFPFMDQTTGSQGTGIAVAEGILQHIGKNPRYRLIDREAFQKVMAEVALSQSGAIEDDAALKAGINLSAKYILTGTILNAFGQKRISAKIIRTETTEIVATATITLPGTGLDEFQKKLFGEKIQVSSSVFRSVLLPGWGQFYTGHNVRGTIAMTLCLGALGGTIWSIMQNSAKYNNYTEKADYAFSESYAQDLSAGRTTEGKYLAEKDDLYSKYTDAHEQMILFIAITGGAWALNIVDATFAGIEAKHSFKPYFAINRTGCPYLGMACSIF